MAQVRWTSQALNDIELIAQFISQDSIHYASLFVNDIISSVERLKNFPQSGRIIPELCENSIREIILGDYRVVYRFSNDVVEILTVFHGSKLFDPNSLN